MTIQQPVLAQDNVSDLTFSGLILPKINYAHSEALILNDYFRLLIGFLISFCLSFIVI